MSRSFIRNVVLILAVTVIAAASTYRVVAVLSTRHTAASPEIGLASAMAGLFAGGLVAVVAIIIVARLGPRNDV